MLPARIALLSYIFAIQPTNTALCFALRKTNFSWICTLFCTRLLYFAATFDPLDTVDHAYLQCILSCVFNHLPHCYPLYRDRLIRFSSCNYPFIAALYSFVFNSLSGRVNFSRRESNTAGRARRALLAILSNGKRRRKEKKSTRRTLLTAPHFHTGACPR